MKRITSSMLVVVAIVGAMSLFGCNGKDKTIQGLTVRNQELQNEKQDLQDQLAQSKAREDALAAELSARQAELDAALAHIREVESKQAGPPTAAGWERGVLGDKVTVGTDILFAAGKADLTSAGKSALDRIAADLNATYSGLPVRVYGHTDSDPIRKTRRLWQDNLDLSANRAMAVTRYLISKGVNAKSVETVAMGESHPVADNSTTAGKAKNRRVEIIAIRR
ncbi:MAG: OmpA family protein [Phycisphaerae bacterium]|nr:OmpA family protein [Phycisphaerae bacterium]